MCVISIISACFFICFDFARIFFNINMVLYNVYNIII